MPTTSPTNHRSLPRRKRLPCARDQDIFIAYRTQGRTQEQLAEDNKVSQRRIGQIIHRVEHWLANYAPPAVGWAVPTNSAAVMG